MRDCLTSLCVCACVTACARLPVVFVFDLEHETCPVLNSAKYVVALERISSLFSSLFLSSQFLFSLKRGVSSA